MSRSMTVEGATDSVAFKAYVEHLLAPSLREGQMVLDGLGAHRTDKVRDLIESRGADLMFLPSYSPDMNLIEEGRSCLVRPCRLPLASASTLMSTAVSEQPELIGSYICYHWWHGNQRYSNGLGMTR